MPADTQWMSRETHFDFSVLLDNNNVNGMHSGSLGAFLVSCCSSEGILPLRTGAASTKIYIERDADWCGQGKITLFLRGAD